MSQTSYSMSMVTAKKGMLADNGPKDIISRTNPDAAMAHGRLAVLGDSDEVCAVPAVTGDVSAKALGIVIADLSNLDSTAVEAKKPMSLLRKGRIWVYSEQAVGPSDTVFVRFGAGGNAGDFRKDADTDKAVALPTAKFVTTVAAAGLVQVEINLA